MNVNRVGRRTSTLSQLCDFQQNSVIPLLYNAGRNIHFTCSKQRKCELKFNACWLGMTKYALTAGSSDFHQTISALVASFIAL